MIDLIAKTKALEKARRIPRTPRAWAEQIQDGKATIEQAPEHFHDLIRDHLETASMYVEATARHILKQQGKEANLEAFNFVPDGMREAVRKRVYELK